MSFPPIGLNNPLNINLVERMRQVRISSQLEDQLPDVNGSNEIDALLEQGLQFDRATILSQILDTYKILLSPETLKNLLDRGAICSPDIYLSIGHCSGMIDGIIDVLFAHQIYPQYSLESEEDPLIVALEAHCSFNTFLKLIQVGCKPNQELFGHAGCCQQPMEVVNYLVSSGFQPSEETLLTFLINLEESEKSPSAFQAFHMMLQNLPVGESATNEMLHIALDNGVPDEVLALLLQRGAPVNYVTYAKMFIAQRNTEWISLVFPPPEPFIAMAFNILNALNEESDHNSDSIGEPSPEDLRSLGETIAGSRVTTEMLNIAIELNVPDWFVQFLIEEKGAIPDQATRHKLFIRGASENLMNLVDLHLGYL